MKYFIRILYLSALPVLSSCTKHSEKLFESTEKEQESVDASAENVIFQSNALRDSISEEMLEENLFGRFFNDRAEFFIVKNPKMSIYGSRVESQTFYYIDGILCKTKYRLAQNIAPQLINAFGKFKILGRDSLNTSVLKNEKVLIGEKTKHINTSLTNYEMTWVRGDKYFVLYVNETYGNNYFELTEKLLDYETRLKSVDVIFD